MDSQTFEDFKSKYLDLYDKTRSKGEAEEKVSIIDDVDFELELIQRDEINVAYILALLAKLKEAELSEDKFERDTAEDRKKSILDMLGTEVQLRSKRELIERFINDYMPGIKSVGAVEGAFEKFWTAEREKALAELCESEGLDQPAILEIIGDYHFTRRQPLREKIVSALKEKPKILARKAIIERVMKKLMDLVATFDDA
jgi:type I restriction enzyme R subunit